MRARRDASDSPADVGAVESRDQRITEHSCRQALTYSRNCLLHKR